MLHAAGPSHGGMQPCSVYPLLLPPEAVTDDNTPARTMLQMLEDALLQATDQAYARADVLVVTTPIALLV